MAIRVGFIGLGAMGSPMAGCLLSHSLETTVYDILPSAADSLVKRGAKWATSPAGVASACDVLCVCVSDDAALQQVFLCDDGIFDGASSGLVVAVHSTVSPETVESVAAAGVSSGIAVIDAPVTGGDERAADGTLTVLLGGDEAAIAKAQPALDAFGTEFIDCGAVGDATRMKLCINVTTYLQWLAGYEGLKLALASGLSADSFAAVGRANGQITSLMQRFLMIHTLPEKARRSEGLQRIVRGPAAVARKDLTHALALARERDVDLPGAALLPELLVELYGVVENG